MDNSRLVAIASVAALAVVASCQEPTQPIPGDTTTWFPFVIPWDDAVPGTATDVSFLNAKPAGVNGAIVVKNGKFVEAKTGARVRFLATNITAGMCFPEKADADKVAARLAKMGVNLVRFHHVHAGWDQPNLWKKDRMFIEIDPVSLGKFDYLLAALKKQGIYWNINLQTSREYIPELGLPESVKLITFGYQKRVDKFYPKMIELQKQYARDFIGRKNPYTGLRYGDDPALMTVEINNENSLVGSPWEGIGRGLASLPEPFRGELKRRWNGWLLRRHKTDAALRKSWSMGASKVGPTLVKPTSSWSHENQSNGDVKVAVAPSGQNTAPNLTVTVNSNPGPDWHVQSHLTGLNLVNGTIYTLKFRAKADKPRTMRLNVSLDISDWRTVGTSEVIPLTTNWKDHAFVFTVRNTVANHTRVAFSLGETTGTVSISNLTLQAGVEGGGLPAGQSLAQRTIDIPSGGTAATMNDWIDFLTDLEKAYAMEMRQFVRKELGVKCSVIDSQISWGGTTGFARESAMEFADNHAYYQHPSFYNGDWNPEFWRIQNRPMSAIMSPGADALGGMAIYRVEGKPYTISEYCHPAPLDAQAEQMPLAMTFAAFQDWDAVYTFDYGKTFSGDPNDKIQSYFAHATNPAKIAFWPMSALLFRQGLVEPAKTTVVLELEPNVWHKHPDASSAWNSVGGPPNLLEQAIAVKQGTKTQKIVKIQGQRDSSSKGSPLGVGPGFYKADTARAKVVSGNVAGKAVASDGAEFRFGTIPSGFAALMLVPKDGEVVERSKTLLMALASRVENQGMGWNEDRSSVGNRWGNGPTICEPVPCTVRLKVDGPRTAFALDGNGYRLKDLECTYKEGWLEFKIDTSTKSLWFEISK